MLMQPWRIQLLGGLSASLHDTRIERFRSRKAAALFAYLALHNRTPTSRELLGEMLWPEEDIDTSRNRLRTTPNIQHPTNGLP
jgi:DNA-binding SARP family transcriptional activator